VKVVVVCWETTTRSREERGRLFREVLAPRILAAGVAGLSLQVADEHARVRSPSPFPLFGRRAVAVVNVWTDSPEQVLDILRGERMEVHAWRSDESVYRDYGDNAHSGPREWPDGERSPGITLVSLLERPASLSTEEWLSRWHGVMSPISERIQPRTRYVRNHLVAALTEDAPAFEGLVEECWPSPRHLTDPWLFYGAERLVELVGHMLAIVRAVHHCFWIWRVQSAVMSEYLLRTPGSETR
jgi:hypothetical protein